MTAAPDPHSLFQVSSSHRKHRSNPLKNLANQSRPERLRLAKLDLDFREASRREDARKLRAAFDGPTQSAMANKGSRALGVSPRQIIYWMQCENDMPSWAVKAVEHYLHGLERTAKRIAGAE